MGSGDRAAVSICVLLSTTYSGAVMRRPVVSSRITERSVGREGVYITTFVLGIIYLSATLGFLTNRRR